MTKTQNNIAIAIAAEFFVFGATCSALTDLSGLNLQENQLCTGQFEECIPTKDSVPVSIANSEQIISNEASETVISLSEVAVEEVVNTTEEIGNTPVTVSENEAESVIETPTISEAVYKAEPQPTNEAIVQEVTENQEIEEIESIYSPYQSSTELGVLDEGWGEETLVGDSSIGMEDYGGSSLYSSIQQKEEKQESPGSEDLNLHYWGIIGLVAYMYSLFMFKSIVCPKARLKWKERGTLANRFRNNWRLKARDK